MEDIDKNMIQAIVNQLDIGVGRKLSESENLVFTKVRSLIGYESILDRTREMSRQELEKYIKELIGAEH